MRKKLKSKKGFTLAELLIVIAIIAVLVAIAVPVFSSQLESSREAVDRANARSASSIALADYMLNHAATLTTTGELTEVTYTFAMDTNKNIGIKSCSASATCVGATMKDGTAIVASSKKCKAATGGTATGDLVVKIKDGQITANSWLGALGDNASVAAPSSGG